MRTNNEMNVVKLGWVPRSEWERQRASAVRRWEESLRGKRRLARERARRVYGLTVARAEWDRQRSMAIESWRESEERKRRSAGDRELVEAIKRRLYMREPIVCCAARSRVVLPCTAQAAEVAKAVISIASETGVLYASVSTVAKAARVSPRCAATHIGALESLGILHRVRSGGLDARGSKITNKYIVIWSEFRRHLGIASKWPRRRMGPAPSLGALLGRGPLFNECGVVRGVSKRTRTKVEKEKLHQVVRAVCIVSALKEQRRSLTERGPARAFLLDAAEEARKAEEGRRARLFADALRAVSAAKKKGDPFGSPPRLTPHASPILRPL